MGVEKPLSNVEKTENKKFDDLGLYLNTILPLKYKGEFMLRINIKGTKDAILHFSVGSKSKYLGLHFTVNGVRRNYTFYFDAKGKCTGSSQYYINKYGTNIDLKSDKKLNATQIKKMINANLAKIKEKTKSKKKRSAVS